jgi:hypothetical protein
MQDRPRFTRSFLVNLPTDLTEQARPCAGDAVAPVGPRTAITLPFNREGVPPRRRREVLNRGLCGRLWRSGSRVLCVRWTAPRLLAPGDDCEVGDLGERDGNRIVVAGHGQPDQSAVG